MGPPRAGAPFGPTGAIGLGLRTLLAGRIRALSDLRQCAASAGPTQRRTLRSLLTAGADTEFGREHGFRRLLRERDDAALWRAYRDAVPVREYAGFAPSIARMREGGEANVLWPGLVRDFAQTSGTTAGDKHMPVSRALLRHNRRAALDIFAHAARSGVSLPRIFSGKCLFLGGSTALETNEHGVRTGDLSGLVTPLIRWPLSDVYLPGAEVALLSDWPAKIDAMAERCLGADIRAVSGMASWSLVLFQRALDLARERGMRAQTLRDLWPNLTLFIHGGVRYDPFDPRVRTLWSGRPAGEGSDIPRRVEVYPASEAFVAIQDTPGDGGLRLCTDHDVCFEFVPLEEIGAEFPPAFACDEAAPGVRYVVVLTTCAGLWRYVLGDVVEFDTVPPDGPPRLRIVGRHRLFINAFGENLIVEHIERAVASAASATGAVIGEFTAAPVYPDASIGRRAGLELAIEWLGGSDAHTIDRFRDAFDRAIKDQNVDYTTKRRGDLGMGPPVVTTLPDGAFHAWMASRGKLGGQHKCPRCANHREIIDAVARHAEPVHA